MYVTIENINEVLTSYKLKDNDLLDIDAIAEKFADQYYCCSIDKSKGIVIGGDIEVTIHHEEKFDGVVCWERKEYFLAAE